MQSRVLRRLAVAASLVLGAGVSVVGTAAARPGRPITPVPRARSAFSLFAGSVNVSTVANRINCNLTNYGNLCYDKTGSGTQEGGFWPSGSPDSYVFNTGLQVGATVSYGAGTGPWVGDTVGVFFMDPRGDQREGDPVEGIYDGANSNDIAAWPTAANVNDTSLFNKALVEVSRGGTAAEPKKTLSQQDTWVRYWDGNTSISAGRKHAMGMLVEQRGMLWAFPAGNQDILYFTFRFFNITTTDAAAYAGLADAGYTASEINDIVALAQDFHARVLSTYGVNLPASGYTFKNMFAAAFQDADVGNASVNYSTANLPFALVSAYKADFSEPLWQFPPDIFHAPFAVAPGFEAVKYLKSPLDPSTADATHPNGTREFGITIWGNTCNGCGLLNDAVGTSQMYRYISGQVRASLGDGSCSVTNPLLYHTCAALQASSDTRFYMSSGPFDLAPGHSSVIVIAMVFAPPVASLPAAGSGIYATPAFSLQTYINAADLKPGYPALPESLAQVGGSYVRPVDQATGWASYSDKNADGRISQDEVATVPGSLLNKALVAQTIFDKKFLLPAAPESPNFFLVPGDNQVTVVWQKSRTDNPAVGDPYFQVASDPTSTLYNPNYRNNDVEGYRIWRGRTRSEMKVIAQFDYSGTVAPDYTGTYIGADYGSQCAPELGITASCPAFPNNVNLVGEVVQTIKRLELADNTVQDIQTDTAVTGGASGYAALTDNGVPFSFLDTNVHDGFQYFYAVTAFDVNSITSVGPGNTSLQSGLVAQSVTPRASSGQESAGAVTSFTVVGGDGSTLDPTAAGPTINATTGIFSGPQPPTDGITGLGFATFLPQVLDTGSVTVTIDSIIPGDVFGGKPGTYWAHSTLTGGVHADFSMQIAGDQFSGVNTANAAFPATTASTAKSLRFGGDSTYSVFGTMGIQDAGDYRVTSFGRANVNGDPANSLYNGPRWWSGTPNETLADPNGGLCDNFNNPTCVSSNRTAGALPGVDSLFWPSAYADVNSQPLRQIEGMTALLVRAADFKVYWNATTAGKVDSVVDVTHKVRVPFDAKLRAGWGILNDSSFVGVNAALTRDLDNSILSWSDIACVDPIPTYAATTGSFPGLCGGTAQTPAVMMDHARLSPIVARGSSYNGTRGLPATGNGFIFYLNGHFFLMQMTALPQNVVWNARFYAGNVTGTAATADFAFQASEVRPPAVPGLRIRFGFTGSTVSSATSDTLFARIHTVPDPYYVTNSFESSSNNKVIRFVNLPSQCIIRIYSLSGVLIRVITHNDPTGGAEAQWDLRNRNQQFVASGVYFYHVEAADGRTKVGRFTVVNFAQ